MAFLKGFKSASRGNVMVMSALVMAPIMMMSAGLIDYGKAIKAKSQISATLDAGVLAAMKEYSHDDSVNVQQVIQDYVAQNLTEADKNRFLENVEVTEATVTEDGELRATVTAQVKTTFLNVFGISTFDVSVFSAAKVGGSSIEVALVLDNTGSMKGSKLNALKEAATNLVEAVMPDGQDDKVKIALVPFADYVNIGKDNRDEAGLDVPADYDYTPPGQHCWNEYPNSTEHCTPVKEWGTCHNDGVPYPCLKTVDWDCTGDLGDPVRVCEDKSTRHYKFRGCMGSRPNGDGEIEESPENGVPGLMETWNWCRKIQKIKRLTNDKGEILDAIDTMKAKRNTYIPSGLVWGWRVLSNLAPFSDGVPYSNDSVSKVIVLLTDGANSQSMRKWYGKKVQNHNGELWGHNRAIKSNMAYKADANAKTEQLCSSIKAKGIMVYTIAFDVNNGSDIKTLLQGCAGNGGRYFDASDSTDLADAFKQIGISLLNLRLSK